MLYRKPVQLITVLLLFEQKHTVLANLHLTLYDDLLFSSQSYAKEAEATFAQICHTAKIKQPTKLTAHLNTNHGSPG